MHIPGRIPPLSPVAILVTAAVLALVAGARGVSAAPARYLVVAGDGSAVAFESRAPMERFTGRTGQVTGWLEADLDDLGAPVRLEVTVDLASFDTGLGKRNQHMRENHFETDTYPVAVFSGGTLAADGPRGVPVGATTELVLTGVLDLHGVRRETTCRVVVDRPDEATLDVEADFEVLLPDHRIERPEFLVLKLAEDQQITARLHLVRQDSR